MNEEELVALRNEAQKAHDDYKAVTERISDYQKKRHEEQAKKVSELVTKTHEVLSDPEKGIPGWGKEKYETLAGYAESLGFPKEAINTFITPEVWHLLNKAYNYDKGKQVATEKINKAPKKIVSGNKAPPTKAEQRNERAKQALARLQESGGDRDSAAEAFLSRWK